MRCRGSALAVALLAALATPGSAQVAVDSVEVQIYAPGDITVTISPRTFTGLVGDTVTFQAVAIDAPTGDTINALLNWSTPTPQNVEIDPMTGHATFLSRGRWMIRVEVERTGGIVLMEMRGGSTFPIGPAGIVMQVGEQRQLCAYVTNPAGEIIARSSTICPFPGSAPAWAFTWPGLLRGPELPSIRNMTGRGLPG